jgi:hypothetical protein
MAAEKADTAVLALMCAIIACAGCCGILGGCASPYIDDGNGTCCPDQNDDSVCDTAKNFTCQDGSLAYDASQCPDTFKCSDGTIVDDESECPAEPLNESRIYSCNDYNKSWPCDIYMNVYCDKFLTTDLEVRKAAAEAISQHPGGVSINQLLDVYAWVKENIFYQNVPPDFGKPYYPNETLITKSGDCKNQAVLIVSMVSAIGGSASLRIVPNCTHAYTYVYVGNESNKDIMMKAVRSRYEYARNESLYYFTRNISGEMEYWVLFDTAGAWYPGSTLEVCLNATETSPSFVIYDCNATAEKMEVSSYWTEFGPWETLDKSVTVNARSRQYMSWTHTLDVDEAYCKFNMTVSSSDPVNWYVMNQENYNKFKANKAASYSCGGRQIVDSNCAVYKNVTETIYLILDNTGDYGAYTNANVMTTCYSK